jgi:hypothetical protein
MYHRIFEDNNGNTVQEFDSEAIEYFIQGFEKLRDSDPGYEITTQSIEEDEEGVPSMFRLFILRKVEDRE